MSRFDSQAVERRFSVEGEGEWARGERRPRELETKKPRNVRAVLKGTNKKRERKRGEKDEEGKKKTRKVA